MDNDDYEKASRQRQWRESTIRPIAARPMTREDMEIHRANLAASYGMEIEDIEYAFQKIHDKQDADHNDCVVLLYTMKCIHQGVPDRRTIYSLKIPVPMELRKKAAQRRPAGHAGARRQKPQPTSRNPREQLLLTSGSHDPSAAQGNADTPSSNLDPQSHRRIPPFAPGSYPQECPASPAVMDGDRRSGERGEVASIAGATRPRAVPPIVRPRRPLVK